MWWHTPVSPAFGRQGQWICLSSSLVRTIQWEPCLKVVVVVGGSRGIKKKQTKLYLCQVAVLIVFILIFKNETPVFPFWHSFYDETTILHNKMLQQATDLSAEVSPAAVLRAHKEESLPWRHHRGWAASPSVLSLGLLFPVAKSCDGIFLISTPHCSPDICDQSHSSPPYVMVSNLVAFSR